MSATVQQIVDRIADEVNRPALVEDQFEELIAYSSHHDQVDEARGYTILHRRASAAVVDWLEQRGIPAARSPVRVPANPDLGMLARVCFPIRERGELLGYLWFVESADRMSPRDVARATRAAAELRMALHRGSGVSGPDSDRVVTAMRQLLGGPDQVTAARLLQDDGYFQQGHQVAAVVLKPFHPSGRVEPDLGERVVSRALRAIRQSVPPHKALRLQQPDHAVLLLQSTGRQAPDGRLVAIGDAVRAALAAPPGDVRVMIGVGGRRAGLIDAADSYREARLAAGAGIALSFPGDMAHWSELGVYQVVAQLADDAGSPRVAHPGLRALIADPEALPLLETLETYLDLAGNAQLAAERLNLHRGSLYYRLQRIEQLANTSLRDGMERLRLHLELKMARLTGDYLPRHDLAGRAAAGS